MSYKDDIKKEIALTYEYKEFNKSVEVIVENIYLRALRESKLTGESIESITYSILEGLDESLKENNKILIHTSIDKMIDSLYIRAIKNLQNKKQELKNLKDSLKENFNKNKEELKEILFTIESFNKEKTIVELDSYLKSAKNRVNQLIEKLNKEGGNTNSSH